MATNRHLTVTIPKEKLMGLLRERVSDLQKEHVAALTQYEKDSNKVRAGQAKLLRRAADAIEAGKAGPMGAYDLRDLPNVTRQEAEALAAPSKPARKFMCSAQTFLAQVSASSQRDWRVSTDLWVELFGQGCDI